MGSIIKYGPEYGRVDGRPPRHATGPDYASIAVGPTKG